MAPRGEWKDVLLEIYMNPANLCIIRVFHVGEATNTKTLRGCVFQMFIAVAVNILRINDRGMSGVRAEISIGRQGDGGGMHQGFSSWGYEMCLKPGCT